MSDAHIPKGHAHLLVIPDEARQAEMQVREDGSVVLHWLQPLHDSDPEPDHWQVTLSADRKVVDVQHTHRRDWEGYSSSVFDYVRQVTARLSGVTVNCKIMQAG